MATGSVQLRRGDIVAIRGERWRIVGQTGDDHVALLRVVACDRSNRHAHATFLLPFETVEHVAANHRPRLVGRRTWRRVARQALAESSPCWESLRAVLPAGVHILPFQLEPVLALATGAGCRLLIADAVGLGKTIQAAMIIAETLARRPEARILVITPAALREQWRRELDLRFHLQADMFDAAGIARLSADLPSGTNPWSARQVVVTSVDFVKRPEVVRSLETLAWDLVVFDEAHNLTGSSDRAAATNAIARRARALVLLTATPHSGDPGAFERLCSIGRLNRSEPLLVFRRTRADVGLSIRRRSTLLRVRPTAAEMAMHAALMAYSRSVWKRSSERRERGVQLAMSVLARRGCSSAASLARSLERRLDLLASGDRALDGQRGLPFDSAAMGDEEPGAWLGYPGLKDAREERDHLCHILGLTRQAAGMESKLTALRRLVDRAAEPIIVFTEYRDTLRQLAASIPHHEVVQLHGGMSARERSDVLTRFADGRAVVLLATDAASEGLNLHHRCRLVVNLELPWTPLRLEQRAGRVDRIGQPRTVHVVHLVARGTAEESTLARLAFRASRMQAHGLGCQFPSEYRVAESVLGERAVPEVEATVPDKPPGLSRPDYTLEAAREACRLAAARSMLDVDATSRDGRGVITRLRRRDRSHLARRAIWVFHTTVATPDGQVVWEPLVALAGDLTGSARCTGREISSLLSTAQMSVMKARLVAHQQLLDRLREALRAPVAIWTQREEALMNGVLDSRARLAAGLLQGSLFDRRTERLAAAQRALRDEAVERSRARLRELRALATSDIVECRLVFAAVIG